MAQKLWDDIQKAQPLSLAFIYNHINRWYFRSLGVGEWGSDNPIKGFIQGWGEKDGDWLTWKASEAVNDKFEKDEAFRTAFEKWALAKFLQLLCGNAKLLFALPCYGSEADPTVRYLNERLNGSGFRNGRLCAGIFAQDYWSKNCGQLSDLPRFVYGFWDEEIQEWNDETASTEFERKLTEQELEFLYKYLTCNSSERKQLYEKSKTIGK